MDGQQNDGSKDTGALYAWLSRDRDGTEGIIAADLEIMMLPLVFTDKARAGMFADHAAAAAAMRGSPARLVKFTRAEIITTATSPLVN